MQPPATHYVERADGVNIAYQVVGEGPFDLLYAPGFISHLDLQWTDPGFTRFLNRLAGFARLILYDKPGTGLSDPIAQLPTLEERTADMVAVLTAAGSTGASVLAFSEGGPAAMLLAATRPELVRSLVLYGTFSANVTVLSPDELDLLGPERVAEVHQINAKLQESVDHWGEAVSLELIAPSVTNEARRRFFGTFERAAASPRMARALVDATVAIDVRAALPAVHCPALVLHRKGDRMIPLWAGMQLAENLPDARFVALEGIDHAFWFGDFDPILDEMERFLTGGAPAAVRNRALATVLFTDVVGSTEHAARLGDRAWRELLERHDEIATSVIAAHDGRIVKHMGDGLLATFDGPARAVECAEALLSAVEDLGVELRAGIHTGEVELMGQDVGGMAVHIGARVGALAAPGEILVSSTVRDLVVGSQLLFSARGEHELKGVPGRWRVYVVGAERAPEDEPLDGAVDHMRAGDRVAVTLARRAPRMMRLGARVMMRS